MQVSVKVSGPFFGPNALSKVRESVHDAIGEVVLTGEREARLMAQPRPGGVFHSRTYAASHGYFQTGHYNRSIHGQVAASLNGTISDSNVVYGPWLELGARGAGRFRGYSIFRRTRDSLEKKAHGILEKHIKKLIGAIN